MTSLYIWLSHSMKVPSPAGLAKNIVCQILRDAATKALVDALTISREGDIIDVVHIGDDPKERANERMHARRRQNRAKFGAFGSDFGTDFSDEFGAVICAEFDADFGANAGPTPAGAPVFDAGETLYDFSLKLANNKIG